jgi:hypothetical protein
VQGTRLRVTPVHHYHIENAAIATNEIPLRWRIV